MLLEALLARTEGTDTLLDHSGKNPLPLYTHKDDRGTDKTAIIMADWSELVTLLTNKALSKEHRALWFHLRIAETLIAQAQQIKAARGDFCVGLSGGVFQNKFLTETIIRRLKEEQFTVFLPDTVPYNDAGLAFGQIIEGNSFLT